MEFETKIHSLIVKPKAQPIFSEQATVIGIADDGAGIYVTVVQDASECKTLTIDRADWPLIKDAVEKLFKEWK